VSGDIPRPVADEEMAAYASARTTPQSQARVSIDASTRAWSARSEMMVDAAEGTLLAVLVATTGARRILEIGTFTGYSAVSMAEVLPPGGHIDTLELSQDHAAKAAEHIAAAGFSDVVSIHQGPASASLRALEGPYDFGFIDADKSGYPEYLELTVPLVRPGGLIVADNVLRGGRVMGSEDLGPDIDGMRAFNDAVVADPRLEVAMLTVRDGVSLIRVR
jgi:caffeoyl-CoA O-methyltransferase